MLFIVMFVTAVCVLFLRSTLLEDNRSVNLYNYNLTVAFLGQVGHKVLVRTIRG